MSIQSSASLWTVVLVVYEIGWFCPGKSSEFKSSFCDSSSGSTLVVVITFICDFLSFS